MASERRSARIAGGGALVAVALAAAGCLPEEFLDPGGSSVDPEPWGPPVACTDTCPAGFSCAWDRCQWDAMLTAVNAARAQPRNCGDYGDFAAAAPLELAPPLTEAAQLHSTTMADTGCFSHDGTGPTPCGDGTPCTRMANAGYRFSAVGENIAYGQDTLELTLAEWLQSPPHCANLMDPGYVHFGASVAFSTAGFPYYTQNFGTPGSATAADCR